MSIEYTFEIVAVDAEAKCMEVVYRASGRQTMHIGTRLPYEGETVEDIVKMYEPVAYWLEQDRPVVVPEIGVSGVIAPAVEQPQPQTIVYDIEQVPQ
jgi:hypothetical protein